jgi:holo-[acyl-carrier protein] synthase
MIIGIGTDMTRISRIAALLNTHGQRFIGRCFHPSERILAPDAPRAAAHYAKRFAAKEAAAKAIGTGIHRGVFLKDIAVHHDAYGAPVLQLYHGAMARAAEKAGNLRVITHLSLGDEGDFASAFVVLEGLQE